MPWPLVHLSALVVGLAALLAPPALLLLLQRAKALAPALRKLRVRQQLLRQRLLALLARHAPCTRRISELDADDALIEPPSIGWQITLALICGDLLALLPSALQAACYAA